MSYATLDQLKRRLKEIKDGSFDDILLEMLEAATEDIETYVSRHFYTWEGIRVFDGAKMYPGQSKMPSVKIDDVLNISQIKLDDGSGTYPLTLSRYLLYDKDGRPNGWPKTRLTLPLQSPSQGLADNIPQGVQITGVFGYGDGKSATPYVNSGDTVQVATTTGTTTIEVSEGELFSPGMLLRIDDEQFYVSKVTLYVAPPSPPPGDSLAGDTPDTNDILTVEGAQGGTTTAVHTQDAVIYIYRYPPEINQICLTFAAEEWAWRDKQGLLNERVADYSYTRDKRDYAPLDPFIIHWYG